MHIIALILTIDQKAIAAIENAISEIEENSCVKFIKKKSSNQDYVFFTPRIGYVQQHN